MTGNEVRQAFLEFFESKGHTILPGISLVPTDPSLLLTAAGVVPFRSIIEGVEAPPAPRVTTCQRCARTPDLESVGDESHLTFFEMLGNFSFGDYYKRESLLWGWEFLTEVLELDKAHLWSTVWDQDDEAYALWRDEIGLPTSRIVKLPREEIFWGPVGDAGACGPCSEIHWDWGAEHGCGPDCNPGCDCGSERFLEIWNHVFTELRKNEDGTFSPLPAKNIDTGMGLERLACVVYGTKNVYTTDLLAPILKAVTELLGVEDTPETLVQRRIIAEHVRSSSFMIMDNITPGNEGREYVLRRLIRRAARTGRALGRGEPFLHRLVETVVETMKPGYPELVARREYITRMMQGEEEAFFRTLEQGLSRLGLIFTRMEAEQGTVVNGEEAFRLYDTYGFPIDLTREMAEERGFTVDLSGFNAAMETQRKQSQEAVATEDKLGGAATRGLRATEFLGYDALESEATVLAVLNEGRDVALDRTPFYAESGGQIGDTGTLTRIGDGLKLRVADTHKSGDVFVHLLETPTHDLKPGDRVHARVDADRRAAIRRAHTATHLLQAALRNVLGTHVAQAGSLVEPDRLRFDFSHFAAMTDAEIREVEEQVNRKVLEDLPVEFRLLSYPEAIKEGAMALFGEKYGAEVRTQRIGDYSLELCGGTHVGRTGWIGLCKIAVESSVGAGLRRIEATTGLASLHALQETSAALSTIAGSLAVSPSEIVPRIERLQAHARQLERQMADLERKNAVGSLDDLLARRREIEGVPAVIAAVPNLDAEGLKSLADAVTDRLGSAVVLLAGKSNGKSPLISKVTPDLNARGLHAGNLIREVAKATGGGGGGRPEFAQGAAKEESRLDAALEQAPEFILAQLNG